MAPEGCSSLYGEFSYIKKSPHTLKKTLETALSTTKKLFKLQHEEIVTEKIITIPRAYVIYDFWREKNLPKIHAQLAADNMYSIGRYGEWKYSSMQEAVLDGKKMAEHIMQKIS